MCFSRCSNWLGRLPTRVARPRPPIRCPIEAVDRGWSNDEIVLGELMGHMKERDRSPISLVLQRAKLDVMRLSAFITLLSSVAVANARPALLDIPGLLQNLGVVQNDRPGVYIKGDPSKGDVRSPCPAVNVLANHGYL
jgi:hypothetical protein